MAYEVTTKEVPAQPVAAIRTHADMATIGETVGGALGRVYGYLGRIGVVPAGAATAVYFDVDPRRGVDVEVCVPVAAPVEGDGGIVADELPGGEVATTLHRGSYEAMEPAYEAIKEWARAHGRELAGPPREVYLNDPETTGPENLETEIDWPIR